MAPTVGPSVDPTFRWTTPGLSADEAAAKQRQNLASPDRKITYCVNRPSEPLHWR